MTFDTILSQETIDEYTKAGYFSNRTITDFLDDAVDPHPGQDRGDRLPPAGHLP